MKKIILTIAAVTALTALVGAAPAVPATVTVSITRAGFVPNTATVKQGDVLTWTNADTQQHQVTSQNPAFASPVLAASRSPVARSYFPTTLLSIA